MNPSTSLWPTKVCNHATGYQTAKCEFCHDFFWKCASCEAYDVCQDCENRFFFVRKEDGDMLRCVTPKGVSLWTCNPFMASLYQGSRLLAVMEQLGKLGLKVEGHEVTG